MFLLARSSQLMSFLLFALDDIPFILDLDEQKVLQWPWTYLGVLKLVGVD